MAWAADGAVQSLPGGPAVRQMDLAPPATQIAADVQSLHYGLLVVCLLIFVGVFGVMFYSILKHRKSLGAKPANFHESVKVEIAWTIVPFIIVACMGFAATKTVVAQKDTSNADLTIKVTGYQWKWGYEYLKGLARASSSCPRWTPRSARCPTPAIPPVTTTCSRWTTRWWCRWGRRCASSPPPTTSSTPG
jgi:heme/copper-type cytochrome/quinol oxidase subunit 2